MPSFASAPPGSVNVATTWFVSGVPSTVLKDVPKYAAEYEAKDWDVRMQRQTVVIRFPEHGMKPRDLMLGIQAFGASRAFLYEQVIKEKLVKDHVGAEPVLLVTGPDDQSVRAFRGQ